MHVKLHLYEKTSEVGPQESSGKPQKQTAWKRGRLAMVNTRWRTTKPRKTRVKNDQLVSPTGWKGETNRCVQDYFVAQPTAKINAAAETKLDRSHELVRMVNRKFMENWLWQLTINFSTTHKGYWGCSMVHSFGSGENSGSTLMAYLSLNQNKRLKNWQNTSQCHWGHSVWCRSLPS